MKDPCCIIEKSIRVINHMAKETYHVGVSQLRVIWLSMGTENLWMWDWMWKYFWNLPWISYHRGEKAAVVDDCERGIFNINRNTGRI